MPIAPKVFTYNILQLLPRGPKINDVPEALQRTGMGGLSTYQ